jgi:hypothetical protein
MELLMRTLFEILKDKIAKPEPKEPTPAERIWNPIAAVPDRTYLTLDVLDYRNKNWRVVAIREYTVQMGGKPYKFTEYVLQDLGTEDPIFFRVCPDGDKWQALIVNMQFDMEWVEELDLAVQGKVRENGEVMDSDDPLNLNLPDGSRWWRVGNVSIPYPAEVLTVDKDRLWGGVKENAERITIFDYWRETQQDGVEATEYVYVEKKDDNGWFQIKRGFEVDSGQVQVF